MHRYRRDPHNVIDWFDYRVAGAPYGRRPFGSPRLHRAWRRHRPWIGRVLLGLLLLGIVALLTSNRRNRNSFWI